MCPLEAGQGVGSAGTKPRWQATGMAAVETHEQNLHEEEDEEWPELQTNTHSR